MRARAVIALILLGAFGAVIWLRDARWMPRIADVAPLLAAPPLLAWLGSPWRLRPTPAAVSAPMLILAAVLVAAGAATGVMVLLAAGWAALLGLWIRTDIEPSASRPLAPLLVLALLAFPWIPLDIPGLGWWFRLSGAAVVGYAFQGLQLDVAREGTLLLVQGLPLSVDTACAGLNVLQAMLIAGFVVLYRRVAGTRMFWVGLGMLPVVAWVANTVRVFVMAFTALTFGSRFAQGGYHTWGGWLALCLMFLGCVTLFERFGRRAGASA